MMTVFADDMTDEDMRKGLTERFDRAIELRQQADELSVREGKTRRELCEAMDEVAEWMEVMDEDLMSVSRHGYWAGYVEIEQDKWEFIMRPEVPPDHMTL